MNAVLVVGCYDLRGGSLNDAAGREVTVTDVVQPNDVPTADHTPAEDVVDAGSSLDADTMDVYENDVTPDVVDATTAPDVTDVPPSVDAVDASHDAGLPSCASGQTRCGDVCVDTAISPAHCGMCGMACPARDNAAPTCIAGTCRSVCNAGFADCDSDASNGCEAALDRAETCGSCGTRCQGGTPLCQESAGTYRCVSGCSGAAGARCGMSCVDPQTDLQHCGACDRACAVPMNGRATCAGGTCAIACNAGYHACGTSCADDTAVASCGSQCTPCPTRANATSTCSGGTCGFTCAAGFADCDGNAANGCEVDTRTSTAHCGMCGRQCGPYNNADHACVAGACAIAMCRGATADCNANIADGCEVLLSSSVAHCGRCGNACPARANATTTCTSGACGFTCNTGFADCDGDASNGCEVGTRDSLSNCGTCGRVCTESQVCWSGRCVSPVRAGTSLPEGRTSGACIWTGSEFILWGGSNEALQATGTGYRYDPQLDRWRAISSAGAPTPRIHLDNSFVWTGQEMFVWGGADSLGSVAYDTGGLYDPLRDAWTAIATTGAPTARGLDAAQWSGSEVVLWGGWYPGGHRGDGARFDPRANRWSAIASGGAPTPRTYPHAVWTGTEFIVWGGYDQNTEDLRPSARYNPALNTWRTISTTGAPSGRHQFSMVWTGREVLVWGGARGNGAISLDDGARYDPATDQWTPITSRNAPRGRQQHATAWTGREMIVWGGFAPGSVGSYGPLLADAAAYDPAHDRWRPISGEPVQGAAASCTQWTGSEVLVAGGITGQPVSRALVRIVPPPRYLSDATPRATDRGLVAHYEFEGDLRDSGSVFGPATSQGSPTFVAGRYGRALACNGTSVAARLPDAPNWRRLTVSVHARVTAPVRSSFVVNGWDVNREHFHIGVSPRNGVDVYSGGNHPVVGTAVYEEIGVFSTQSVTTGSWVHMALVADETAVILYVEGEEFARRSQGGVVNNLGRDILTGVELCGSSRNNNSYFLGAIDDLRLYDRALSVDEIRALR